MPILSPGPGSFCSNCQGEGVTTVLEVRAGLAQHLDITPAVADAVVGAAAAAAAAVSAPAPALAAAPVMW